MLEKMQSQLETLQQQLELMKNVADAKLDAALKAAELQREHSMKELEERAEAERKNQAADLHAQHEEELAKAIETADAQRVDAVREATRAA